MDQHKPEAPHWYLFAIGTDPQSHGTGCGHRSHSADPSTFATCEGLATHLDTNTEANVRFYESRGFHVSGEFDLFPPDHTTGR